jgi:hypothetical protein
MESRSDSWACAPKDLECVMSLTHWNKVRGKFLSTTTILYYERPYPFLQSTTMLRSLVSKLGVKGRSRRRNAPTQEYNQLPSSSSGSSHLLAQHPQLESPSPIANPPPSGFLAGATNVNANHGVFTDIAGDVNIIQVEMQVCLE